VWQVLGALQHIALVSWLSTSESLYQDMCLFLWMWSCNNPPKLWGSFASLFCLGKVRTSSSQGGVHIQGFTIFRLKWQKLLNLERFFVWLENKWNIFFTKYSKIKPISTRIVFGWVTLPHHWGTWANNGKGTH
jgi:hypothetical protein